MEGDRSNNIPKTTCDILKEKYDNLDMENTKELTDDQLRSMIDCKHITKIDMEYPSPSENYKPYWK